MVSIENLQKNQTIIRIDTKKAFLNIFFSYETFIGLQVFANNKDSIFLDKDYWNYSNTTSKYRNLWLQETTQKIKEKINNGTYQLVTSKELENILNKYLGG